MSIDQYVIKQVPETLSEIVPCLMDLGAAAIDLKVEKDEEETVVAAATNITGLGIRYGVSLVVKEDSPLIGDSPECTPERAKQLLDEAVGRCVVVQSDTAGIDPATILFILQVAKTLYDLWKNRKK